MKRFLSATIFLLIIGISFSFYFNPQDTSGEVKQYYKNAANQFVKEVAEFEKTIRNSNEKLIRQQFLRVRIAYKKIELFTEYFYPFYATRLNGPPISFFEEADPDKGEQQPAGMQLIETYIYHGFSGNKKLLQREVHELLRNATEMLIVEPSFDLNDNNIFDAVMEELYRITALGITGFDSQMAANSLAETAIALESIRQVVDIYSKQIDRKLPGHAWKISKLLKKSAEYLRHNNFNSFNRMAFIRDCMNPLAALTGKYKNAEKYIDNQSPLFYSAIKKNNTLFNPTAFDPYRFLDDYSSSPSKFELGRKLFFEKRLSSNAKRSCADCHQPQKGFTDGLQTSRTLDGHSFLPRNAPTLWNAALQRNLFMDSRGRNLEDQVLQVLNNANEMHGSAKETSEKIILEKEYSSMYKQAFPGTKSDKTVENICNAIASFERTLIALNARFDQHMRGDNILSGNEVNGFNLFMGKAKCGTCHFMPLFSGSKPPRYYFIESEVLGIPAKAGQKPARPDSDSGRYLVTKALLHLFAFKTPGIRNVALTAPYMHNGVFKTLEEVVDFYNEGGGKGLNIDLSNQSLPFEKLGLSANEKRDIILFMKTLTDTSTSY